MRDSSGQPRPNTGAADEGGYPFDCSVRRMNTSGPIENIDRLDFWRTANL